MLSALGRTFEIHMLLVILTLNASYMFATSV